MKTELLNLKKEFADLNIPEIKETSQSKKDQILLVTNGDLRLSANQECWAVQEKYEEKLQQLLTYKYKKTISRCHDFDAIKKHGFIDSQRYGSDIFQNIDNQAPIIVLLTAWQYSHHIAPSLAKHQGPILVLANFDGKWPGLVGALNLEGTLTSLGVNYARLWSENFDDDFFFTKLEEWLQTGKINHNTKYLHQIDSANFSIDNEWKQLGAHLANHTLKKKEIIGLFDSFCMGMINGVFPQKALCDIGMPMESLSQSMLVHEMSKVSLNERKECLAYYKAKGMNFHFGSDSKTELTEDQVLEQCAMLIALVRVTNEYGLTGVGVQYQQGLKDICAASDFAEGAIGSKDRFPIKDKNGNAIRPNEPIPHFNEVDTGSAIPQIMIFKLLKSLGLPCETTLHDIRWGSDYQGQFYWDLEISGNVPFSHIKGGIAGAHGYRQPAMYFAKGGSTISGQCKAGDFIWARAHYEDTKVHLHVGTGTAFELPEEEYKRRSESTTDVWPLMNVVLDGVDKNSLMAGHQSNHITVAYIPKNKKQGIASALTAMGVKLGMNVKLAGIEID